LTDFDEWPQRWIMDLITQNVIAVVVREALTRLFGLFKEHPAKQPVAKPKPRRATQRRTIRNDWVNRW
jgi:hypothetical protein